MSYSTYIQTLSIIIPAYNEELTILKVLKKVDDVVLINSISKEIIIVDDASTDNTKPQVEQFIREHPLSTVFLHTQRFNQGKGSAIQAGIKIATGEYIVIQDADLEYDPLEYNLLLKPVVDGVADAVFGSRFMGGNPHRILFFWHSIGNKFLTFFSNMFTGLNLTDMETGYKLIRTSLLKQMTLKEKRFGFEPEVTAKLSKIYAVRIYEIGISYYGRTFEEGKKINWIDGVKAIYCILKYNLLYKK